MYGINLKRGLVFTIFIVYLSLSPRIKGEKALWVLFLLMLDLTAVTHTDIHSDTCCTSEIIKLNL